VLNFVYLLQFCPGTCEKPYEAVRCEEVSLSITIEQLTTMLMIDFFRPKTRTPLVSVEEAADMQPKVTMPVMRVKNESPIIFTQMRYELLGFSMPSLRNFADTVRKPVTCRVIMVSYELIGCDVAGCFNDSKTD
jgi:hypothetical protein